jgi:hypothetical protein
MASEMSAWTVSKWVEVRWGLYVAMILKEGFCELMDLDLGYTLGNIFCRALQKSTANTSMQTLPFSEPSF